MNIIYITKKIDKTSGGDNFSLDLAAQHLAERGHDVSIVTMKSDQNNLFTERNYSVIKKRGGCSKKQKIPTLMNNFEDETDIYHIWRPDYLTMGGTYRSSGGDVPVIGRLNTYTAFCTDMTKMDSKCYKNCTIKSKFLHSPRNPVKKIFSLHKYYSKTYMDPKLINELDALFAISPVVKNIYSSNGISEKKITTIPNFYDPEFKLNTVDYNSDNENFQILYAGRFRKFKGVDILIKSLSKVADMGEEGFTANILGYGKQEESLKQLTRETDMEEYINFPGYINPPKLQEYYAQSNIFVHPGRWPEPFGRSVLEALQYNLPVVCSDIGAPPWIASSASLTFQRNNVEDLADKIFSLIQSKDKHEKMKENCGNEREKFAPNKIVGTIEEEYQSLL